MTSLHYARTGGPPDDWQHVEALLDGVPVDHAIEANSEEGWLIRYRTGADGLFIIDGDRAATERLTGVVTLRRKAARGATAISSAEAVDRMIGDNRALQQIAKDGARVVISQIQKLRNRLDQAERAAQHTIATGRMRKGDDAIWRRVKRAADNLLEGMVE